MFAKQSNKVLNGFGVLIADKNPYGRKLLRAMLINLGAKIVYEAADGVVALDLIRTAAPDVMILDWELPILSGMQVVRIVRSPGVFPKPDLPIIMLTADAKREQVIAALQCGVNEFLVKPISPKTLQDRLFACLLKPRSMMSIGNFYVPEPRWLTIQSP